MSLTTDKVDIQTACTADQAQRRAYISLGDKPDARQTPHDYRE